MPNSTDADGPSREERQDGRNGDVPPHGSQNHDDSNPDLPSPKGTGGDSIRDWDAEFAAITQGLELSAPSELPPITRSLPNSPTQPSPQVGAGSSPWNPTETPGAYAGSAGGSSSLKKVSGPIQPDLSITGFRYPEDDDADDVDSPATFEPAAPTSLGVDDPKTHIMLACLLIGPLWLIALAVFFPGTSLLWWAAAVAVSATGFVMAVLRQPKDRTSNPWDDGARL